MSSGFVSENELEERRKLRQQEWEKVRRPDQPLEMPEEKYDHRSLYERLEEQKQKIQLEYEEAHKLKNMIKGLDDDEIEFLDLVDQKKLEAEQLKELEEKQELLDFRKKVEQLKETTLDQRIQAEIQPSRSSSTNNSGSKSQHHLLKGVVVKKKSPNLSNGKQNEKETKDEEIKNPCCGRKRKREEEIKDIACKHQIPGSNLTCVGILPGLGSYIDSSDDSDYSLSDSDPINDKKYDLIGRRILNESKNDPE